MFRPTTYPGQRSTSIKVPPGDENQVPRSGSHTPLARSSSAFCLRRTVFQSSKNTAPSPQLACYRQASNHLAGKAQAGVPSPVFSGSSAARRSTIRVARATFRPVRFAPRAVRRTARRAFRIAFRPARRILRATRRPIRRDCRAARRLARRARRLACLFLRGMFSSLTMMCHQFTLALPPRTGLTRAERHTTNSAESYRE